MPHLGKILLFASVACFAAGSNGAVGAPSSPPPGWASDANQGGSDKDCKVPTNPGCTEVAQPQGQVGKEGNSSPKVCDGPPGQQPDSCR
jgi:hypothetical protein